MNQTQATYTIRSLTGAIWAGRTGPFEWSVDFVAAFSTGLPVLVCGPRGSGKHHLADQLAAATGLQLRHLRPQDGASPRIGQWLTHDEKPPHLNFISHLDGLRYGPVLTSLIGPLEQYWDQREPEAQWILASTGRCEDLDPQVRFKFGVALATAPPPPAASRPLPKPHTAELPRAVSAADLAALKTFLAHRGAQIRKRRHDELAHRVQTILAGHRQGRPTDLHGYRPWHAGALVTAAYELLGVEDGLDRAMQLVSYGRVA